MEVGETIVTEEDWLEFDTFMFIFCCAPPAAFDCADLATDVGFDTGSFVRLTNPPDGDDEKPASGCLLIDLETNAV